jgi:HSP20 family protein
MARPAAIVFAPAGARFMSVRVHAWGSDFDDLADQVRAMLQGMESPHFFRSRAPDAWSPRLNLYETADRFVVCVELAGVSEEQFDVCTDERTLLVHGVRRKPILPENPTDVSVHVMEIDSGRFMRRIPIPPDVVMERITCTYRRGYLWITLPRDAGPDNA